MYYYCNVTTEFVLPVKANQYINIRNYYKLCVLWYTCKLHISCYYDAGSTRGGTQLQDYVSVGTKSYGTNTELTLLHGSTVTVTVMATNAAGLTSLLYSNATTIDLSPPIIYYVNDGFGQNGKFQVFEHTSILIWYEQYEDGLGLCSRENET